MNDVSLSVRPIESTSTTEATRELLTRFYECFGHGKETKAILPQFYHPDIVVELPSYLPYGGIHVGLGKVLGGAAANASDYLDFRTLRVESMCIDGEVGIGVVRVNVTDSEDEMILAHHWTVRDGKIVHMRFFPHDPGPIFARMNRLTRGSIDTRR